MFGCNSDRLFSEKFTVKDYISNTKLEKCYHYYIQTRYKDLFSKLQSYSEKTLRKNVPKSARKYKRSMLMTPGHPILVIVLTKAAPGLFIKWNGEYFLK